MPNPNKKYQDFAGEQIDVFRRDSANKHKEDNDKNKQVQKLLFLAMQAQKLPWKTL